MTDPYQAPQPHQPPPGGWGPPAQPGNWGPPPKKGLLLTPKALIIGAVVLLIAVVGIVIGVAATGSSKQTPASAGSSSSGRDGTITGDRDEWFAAVCEPGTVNNGGAHFPNSSAGALCQAKGTFYPIIIGAWESEYIMTNDLKGARLPFYTAGSDGSKFYAFATRIPDTNNTTSLEPLNQFGFKLTKLR